MGLLYTPCIISSFFLINYFVLVKEKKNGWILQRDVMVNAFKESVWVWSCIHGEVLVNSSAETYHTLKDLILDKSLCIGSMLMS